MFQHFRAKYPLKFRAARSLTKPFVLETKGMPNLRSRGKLATCMSKLVFLCPQTNKRTTIKLAEFANYVEKKIQNDEGFMDKMKKIL